MAIQWFLNHLNTAFNNDERRKLIQAYRQDPLVWKALDTIEHPEDWIAIAGNNFFNWQVAHFILYTLKPDLFHEDYRDLSLDLPEDLCLKSERLIETIRTTGLEPSNLNDAIHLAIALRNYRLEHDSWTGLAEYLLTFNKRLESWKTAFVVLPALVPDIEDAFFDLSDYTNNQTIKQTTALILHATNTMMLDENERYQLFNRLAGDATIDVQLYLLKGLSEFESPAFVRLLASSLRDLYAEINSPADAFEQIELNRKLALLE